MHYNRISRFCAFAFLVFSSLIPPSLSARAQDHSCNELLSRSSGEIRTLDDLLLAFTRGLEPDLNIQSHRLAFEMYRKMLFGDPTTNIGSGSLNEIAETLKKFPWIKKPGFRNYELRIRQKSYPVTDELKKFLKPKLEGANQALSNLYSIDSNIGYWKKVFQYEGEAKDFPGWFAQRIPEETRRYLKNPEFPGKTRAARLYRILMNERSRLAGENKKTHPIHQAIIDVIHTVGLHDPAILARLKSNDGLEQINGFYSFLEARESFLLDEGDPNCGFQHMLIRYGVQAPSGIDDERTLLSGLETLQASIKENPIEVLTDWKKRTLRTLSLIEAPFRSCIGGADCSSRTYFLRALDPNYIYFTLTDATGHSDGQITVVLGEARPEAGPRARVAFLDKVQNIDHAELPLMLEGVRGSLEEQGYVLAMPRDMGDHNGISNSSFTRIFLQSRIKTDPGRKMTRFSPHKHAFWAYSGYSRADNGLTVYPVLPFDLNEDFGLSPGAIQKNWNTGAIDMDRMIGPAIELKHGSPEDRIRYLATMRGILDAGFKADPDFERTILEWIADLGLSFPIRKQALIVEMERSEDHGHFIGTLFRHLPSFSREDQIQIIQNLLDTPRHRSRIMSARTNLPDLMILVRKNKSIRTEILEAYSSDFSPLIEKVLGAEDVSDRNVIRVIGALGNPQVFMHPSGLTPILSALEGSSIESWVKSELVKQLVKNGGDAVSPSLRAVLTPGSDPAMIRAGLLVLERLPAPESGIPDGVRAFRGISPLVESGHAASFEEAARMWLAHPVPVVVEDWNLEIAAKAEAVLSRMGSGERAWNSFWDAIPGSEREAVAGVISKKTGIPVFLDLAKKRGLSSILFGHGLLESFRFQPVITGTQARRGIPFLLGSEEKSRKVVLTEPFEMQVTPFTQLQITLLTGTNRSFFSGGGIEVMADGRRVALNPDLPVESYSWNEIQSFLKELNANDPVWNYRLPTDAEWEYAARAGGPPNHGRHGDLRNRAWFLENSQQRTRPVARLQPNALGIHDLYGNVWEWVEDRPSGLSLGLILNPSALFSVFTRICRGGSHKNIGTEVNSSSHIGLRPDEAKSTVGFRLVRTPKKKQ